MNAMVEMPCPDRHVTGINLKGTIVRVKPSDRGIPFSSTPITPPYEDDDRKAAEKAFAQTPLGKIAAVLGIKHGYLKTHMKKEIVTITTDVWPSELAELCAVPKKKFKRQRVATYLKLVEVEPKADLTVFVDGSHIPDKSKPKKDRSPGHCGIGVYFQEEDRTNLSEAYHGSYSSCGAELIAVIRALEVCKDDGTSLRIVTDFYSTTFYSIEKKFVVINGNGPESKTSVGRALRAMVVRRKSLLYFRLVPGHASIYGNGQAHKLAYGAAQAYKAGKMIPREIDIDGYLEDKIYVSRSDPDAFSGDSKNTDGFRDDNDVDIASEYSDDDSYMSVDFD
ncbi:hypothetical protein EC973_001657 [Apophysomyces ossiformis]|uniref:RNase H type-1 domain-containing protein n=1 Tax=Apophysomyces ossiformis TaxID=679940 RepID=A0A8H7BWM6_9FUNG|nr:hypothetical protein EC973_001657 [Apophysomyces ossiformis]